MTANIQAMLRAAVDAAHANRKADARALLERVLELDEYNEQAWVELSKLVDNLEEKRTCLENVLVINPSNSYAKEALSRLDSGMGTEPSPLPSAPAFSVPPDDLFAGAAFDNQNINTGWSDEPDPWTVPTSSASVQSEDDYSVSIPDDWATNLVKKSANPVANTPAAGAFTSFDDDDLFSASSKAVSGGSPFDASDFSSAPPVFETDDFDLPTDALDSAPPRTGVFTSPFDAGSLSKPAFSSPVVEDDFDAFTSLPSASVKNSAADLDDFRAQLETVKTDDFSDLFDERPKQAVPQYEPLDQRSPEELFALIPPEIKPGRMPGTDGTLAGSAVLLLALSILLNIGAFAFLIARVMGISPI
jgi:hypothetical protein